MIGVTMTRPGGVTLATSGKYCPDNVQITPVLQVKTVKPQVSGNPDPPPIPGTVTHSTVTPDEGYAGLSRVEVQFVSLQDSRGVIPGNEAQTVTPDEGYDGLSQVTVAAVQAVAGSGTPAEIALVSHPGATAEGAPRYFSQFTVEAVPTASLTVTPAAQPQTCTAPTGRWYKRVEVLGDANLVPENIRSGVTIFGVTGTA